ncbi:hypothetical protein Aros01_09420 [Streptosporangium roseum]|uniref:Uncharacterized protein n=1 Tax=Streptosporangium roseum (strain ATCC 12428 / DSM 43021 / JCM 3005 / KCTC 9067 / NCIMB 10171 / NRRL 2505 / NI 9100) TaxID=479432 RepID=D2B358_STRRD|nr:hypothetical protein Sros_2564 [Streptosporangium roseum DSM 43021]
MLEKLEMLGDRLLSRFVPATTAAASCPCGSYPYTGPCWYTLSCGGGKHQDCYCTDSARYISCSSCH